MNSEHPLVSTTVHATVITRHEPTMAVHMVPDGAMLTKHQPMSGVGREPKHGNVLHGE